MCKHRIKTLAVLAASVMSLLCLLAGCGGKLAAPESYQIGEDTVPALTLEEGAGALKGLTEPEEDGEEEYTYTYDGLPEGGAAVKGYAELLTGEEGGFLPIDETGQETATPDYTQPEGEVRLAKTSTEAGRRFEIDLSWTETGCVVTVARPEGTVTAAVQPVEPMTLDDAVSYLQGYTPNELGLAGQNMREYRIYPKQGMVLVNGEACLEVNIYGRSQGNTNQIAGTYLLTGDRAHLYRLNSDSGTLSEIELKH